MPDLKAGRGVSGGCLCGILGIVIALGTVCYAIVNREEFHSWDSAGYPGGR
jgi:hypothetical protein